MSWLKKKSVLVPVDFSELSYSVHRVARAQIADFLAAKRAEGCGIDVRMLLLLGQGIIAGEQVWQVGAKASWL